MTSATLELRARPPHGDIRTERLISAESRALAERAASIRRLRERPARGEWFVGRDLHRAV